jgi:hypothetical protein
VVVSRFTTLFANCPSFDYAAHLLQRLVAFLLLSKSADWSLTFAKPQGFEPSEPQWSMGKNMELMLPQLEQRLFPPKAVTTP